MIIAIDFDGTIVYDEYPGIGELKPHARLIINELSLKGHQIIINTCRTGAYEGYAEKFLDDNCIFYDYINCNLPEKVIEYGQDCRKISADVYIDDKSLDKLPEDWFDIRTLLELNYGI